MHTRQRDYERRLEEAEEKVNRSQDEAEEMRRKAERLERTNWEQRR